MTSHRPARRLGWRLLRTAALSFAAAWAILAYGAQLYRVEGASMIPALRSGERVLVNKIGPRLLGIGRGDVVVFRDPRNPETTMVKRIVGLPGDTIRFRGDEVAVLPSAGERSEGASPLAGAPAADGCGGPPRANLSSRSELVPPESPAAVSVAVGNRQYFALGDNRAHSSDSRHWGLLPQEAIIGRAALVVSPVRRMGLLAR